MTLARIDDLADAVLDAWQSGAEVDRFVAGGNTAEQNELAQLERAALLAAAGAGSAESARAPMRAEFFARLAEIGRATTAQQVPPPRAVATRPSSMGLPRLLIAAAAGFAAASIVLQASPSLSPTEARAAFLATGKHARIEWKTGQSQSHGSVHGDVVWCATRQEGYMQLDGLEPLPQEQQYQLWIVDGNRTGAPVDGGVFDLASTKHAVVPIAAKLPIGEAKAFVITVETRGGVVVSDQKDVVAIASL